MDAGLTALMAQAVAAYAALTPEAKAEHDRLQRESFVRGMQPWPDAKPPKMINGVLTYESFYDYCAD